MRDLVDPFIAHWRTLRPDLDPGWLATSPPPLPRHPDSGAPLLPQQDWLLHYYVLNETLLRSMWVKGKGLREFPDVPLPDQFTVFTPPNGRLAPYYRYPPSTTLPTGLVTNAFGFRGRELTVDKPARTLRIAFVGASTTVEAARLPHSAPELIEHWLQLWARARSIDLDFETLNAAREAIQSSAIRAIVEDEVLPLAPDYVVYYEGANQFQPVTLQKHVRVQGDYQLANPPPGLVGTFDEAETADTTWLDRLAGYSAAADRLRWALRGQQRIAEPPKPAQELVLPPGFDTDPFPLERAGEVLECGSIGADLEAIRSAVQAAGGELVLCTFARLVQDGMTTHPVLGHNIHVQLDRAFWPFRYATIRRLSDLQNRFFAAWARAHGADLIDVAGQLPFDERLYIDSIHQAELGVRLKAWVMFAALTTVLERDLGAHRVPVPGPQLGGHHPNLGPRKIVSRSELDAGR